MRNIHVTVTTGASLFGILEALMDFKGQHEFNIGQDVALNIVIHAGADALAKKETK